MSRPMSYMKMRKLSIFDDEQRAKKVKKVKSKEEKEMAKTFEKIAKRLLSSACEEIREDLEGRVRESISRTNSDVRHDIIAMEAALSSRVSILENKVTTLTTRLEEMQQENNKKFEQLQKEIADSGHNLTTQIETERNKRLSTAKKLQEKSEQSIQSLQNNFSTFKHDNSTAFQCLSEDLRLQVKEIVGLKEKVDEILIKQLGHLPRTTSSGKGSLDAQGLETGMILENISNRIQKLEQAVVESGDDFQTSFILEKGGSPMRGGGGNNNVGSKRSLNRIRRIEEQMFELESQIKENETDIAQIKQNMMKQLRSRSDSPTRGGDRDRDRDCNRDNVSNADIKDVEKKIKKLAESTTRACKSLSTGLTDVQQATLSLYSWTDRVHDSFDILSQKLNLPPNLCPRANISNGNGGNSRKLGNIEF